KESFANREQLSAFMNMIFNAVQNAMTLKLDNLVMRAINNMTAETMLHDLKGDDGIDLTQTGNKAINLLKLYNEQFGDSLTVNEALTNADFIRYSSYIINLYKDRLTRVSTLFNIGGKERFTPESDLTVVLLSDFSSAINTF